MCYGYGHKHVQTFLKLVRKYRKKEKKELRKLNGQRSWLRKLS